MEAITQRRAERSEIVVNTYYEEFTHFAYSLVAFTGRINEEVDSSSSI